MTIDQMRAILGLDESVSDADVVAAYAAYLLTTGPAAEPLSVEEAKAQLGLTDSDTTDDPMIGGLIIAARQWAENYTGHVLTAREVVETRDAFTCWLDLYAWPVRSITSIQYLDGNGALQSLDVSAFAAPITRRPVRLTSAFGSRWPVTARMPAAVTITMQAGYESPEAVPQAIKQAMLLMIRHWYDNRSAVAVGGSGVGAVEVPMGAAILLDPYRDRTC